MTTKFTRGLVAAAVASTMALAPGFVGGAEAAPMPAATIVAKSGSKGTVVKNIQNDLRYLGYYTKNVDGDFGPVTASAVKSFQKAYRLPVTGVVDTTTYRTLRTKSDAKRTADRKAAAARAAAKQAAAKKAQQSANKVVAKPGDKNATVKQIQGRLSGLGYLPASSIIGVYGPQTTAAVKAFQKRYGLAQTGVVNLSTHNLLIAKYKARPAKPRPAAVALDSRCLTGRTICVHKRTQRMYWVVNGSIQRSWSVRTGRPSLPTRSGSYKIYLKHPNWYSTLYHVNMPYTQFFSGGQAVHYSAEFARIGHSGSGSHGCVNMNSMSEARWLYNRTRVGDKVVVY
ncbi:L,D-transpeptidase family protein [Luteococcus peritonei]|uniref:Peptidoglycan-binding protein n=1 Tax=Luteococcus peritonei TaxID=88874 RepID=A0ABW4RZ25_9ACTN